MFHNRNEIGRLHLFVQPLYAQSRDCTANMENVNRLPPNTYNSPKKEIHPEGEAAALPEDEAASSTPVEMEKEAGNVAQPQLRKNERVLNQGQSNTFRSVSSSQKNTLHSSYTSGTLSAMGAETLNSDKSDVYRVDLNDNSTNPSVYSHTTSPHSPTMDRNYENSIQDSTKYPLSSAHSSVNWEKNLNLNLNLTQDQDQDQDQNQNQNQDQDQNQNQDQDLRLDVDMDMDMNMDMDLTSNNYMNPNSNQNLSLDQNSSPNPSSNPSPVGSRSLRGESALSHVEIKKVANAATSPTAPITLSGEPKYISQCQAIIRKNRSMYKQGVHLISRPRNDYIENMKFVL